jgi:hypothetical protein
VGLCEVNLHRSEWHLARALALWIAIPLAHAQTQIGREVAISQHLDNGQEFQISLTALLDFGKQLFMANWTIHEGQGRPLAKHAHASLGPVFAAGLPAELQSLLGSRREFVRRLSYIPIAGGAGDIVANVFVPCQRFDSITMDHNDAILTRVRWTRAAISHCA